MTPQEFANKMQEIFENNYDPEGNHCNADDLLCAVLIALGYGEGIGIFKKADKWYA